MVIYLALTVDDIRQIARLARLELSAAEEQLYTDQLNQLIEQVEEMSQVDTDGVAPMYHPIQTQHVREDKPRASMSQEKALSQAPDVEAGCFRVPKITEG